MLARCVWVGGWLAAGRGCDVESRGSATASRRPAGRAWAAGDVCAVRTPPCPADLRAGVELPIRPHAPPGRLPQRHRLGELAALGCRQFARGRAATPPAGTCRPPLRVNRPRTGRVAAGQRQSQLHLGGQQGRVAHPLRRMPHGKPACRRAPIALAALAACIPMCSAPANPSLPARRPAPQEYDSTVDGYEQVAAPKADGYAAYQFGEPGVYWSAPPALAACGAVPAG